MRTFLAHLFEALEVKQLKHLTHVEDHPINAGKEGFEHAKRTLSAVHAHMTGEGDTQGVKITEKFDGAPSIVFGRHPQTGKFFVASKSAFNKNPKINYSEEDIERNHGHAPGLVEKLKAALKHLPKVTPKHGVYQGDMMFTKPDVQTAGGAHHFTPNTVTHTVDANSDEGRAVKRAQMGIVVHTKYEEHDEHPGLENMSAGFDVDHDAFKHHGDVHMINPNVNFQGTYTPTQRKMFLMHMRKAQAHHDGIGTRGYKAMQGHDVHMNTYINSTVRNGTKPSVQGYQAYLRERQAKEVASVKTDKAKQVKHQHHQGLIDNVEKNKDVFENAFNMHHHLQQAKNQLISALETHKRGSMSYSITGNPSRPEGFVAIVKNKQGESLPSKLVSREPGGFAAANLQGMGKFQKAAK
jgi:hypothetical protein